MDAKKLNKWIRICVGACGLLIIPVIILPMWRIELTAPQYPEGLVLQIFPGKLGGDVEIVNGLNHYIGMQTLHTEDFFEFTILPYLLGGFALLGIVTAVVNRHWVLYTYVSLLIGFAVLSMIDFWRWEYNYGHNLDPSAPIQVPDMSYQPPLLGYKQLLNFGAFSIPDIGGWIFASVGAILLACAITQYILNKKTGKLPMHTMAWVAFTWVAVTGCSSGPQAINFGRDACHFCKMTISDNRFGAELVTAKGKVYKFDDVGCLISFIKSGEVNSDNASVYITDFDTHQLALQANCLLLKSEALKSPMNSNVAAFTARESLEKVKSRFAGSEVKWIDLIE